MYPYHVIMGIDLGFVQTKASVGDWEEKFGSIVKPRSEVAVSDLEDSEGYVVTYNGVTYNVGSKGSYDFKADRLSRDTDIVKLLTVFGLHQKRSITEIETIVTGLPVYEFNNYKENLRKTLEGWFQYEFNGETRQTRVKNASVIPQSAGAFYDYILDSKGEVKDEPLASEDVLVLDIGGRTTDGCIMEGAKYSQDSFTIFQGVWKAHNELRRLIAKEHRYTLKPFEVDKVMRSGALKLGSREVGVKDLVYKAVASVYPEMRDELTLHVDDFRRYSAVLLTGGGAHVYGEFLEQDIECPVIVTEGAEYANARGYRKYGLLMAQTAKG